MKWLIFILIPLHSFCQITGIRGFYRQNAKLAPDTVAVINADAQRFIDSAVITDANQKKAINRLVLDLKGVSNPNYYTLNIWSKFKAAYPFVGGTSFTHKWNLVNPVDADTSFRLTFQNSPTHNASGVTFDKTLSQLAFTHFIASVQLDSSSNFFGCYQSQAGGVTGQTIQAMGSEGTGAATYGRFYVATDWGEDGNGLALWSSANSFYQNLSGTPKGFFLVNKTGSTQQLFKNGLLISTQSEIASLPPYELYLGAWNQSNIPAYSSSTLSFAFVGYQSLSVLEAIALSNAVQFYEYTLSRQVN